jgi:two-component system response regulator DegU
MRITNRVLVVEDFQPFRCFLSSLLQEKSDFEGVYEASDGVEAVSRARELSPDLILMDIGLPGLNGIEAARQIQQYLPSSKIVFLSQENSAEVVQEALSFGALGFVHKSRAGMDLFPAMSAALQGKQFISSGLLELA